MVKQFDICTSIYTLHKYDTFNIGLKLYLFSGTFFVLYFTVSSIKKSVKFNVLYIMTIFAEMQCLSSIALDLPKKRLTVNGSKKYQTPLPPLAQKKKKKKRIEADSIS